MTTPKIGSLFSGIGGLDLAVEYATGGQTVWQVEWEQSCQDILAANWPNAERYGDVTTIDWTQVAPVDILCGGYPCQPFSHAGNRKGAKDERHLWPFVKDAISALGPKLVVLENVAGHLTLGGSTVIGEIAELGYDAEWGVVRASDAGAPHQRKRLFIVAYPRGQRYGGWQDGGTLGQLDGRDALQAWQRQRSWEESEHRSTEASSDSDSAGCEARSVEGRGCQCSRIQSVGRSAPSSDSNEPGSQGQQSEGRRFVSTRCDGPDHGTSSTEEINWGKYELAVKRWEKTLGVSAPAPADDQKRLNPTFVEWMMGFPLGWTSQMTRPKALKALGNAVCPQQGALALSMLLN